jgi:protocatechuate 3,4-dioxygenase beta subunit
MDVSARRASSLLLLLVLIVFFSGPAFAASIGGTIYNGSNAVAGASVTLNNSNTFSVLGATRTNSTGSYSFENVSDGNYSLSIAGPASSATVNGIVVNGSDVTQNVIQVQTAVTLYGKVANTAGLGIGGVRVYIEDQITLTEVGLAVTDIHGDYTLPVPSGTYTITIRGSYADSAVPVPQWFGCDHILQNISVTADTRQDIVVPLVTLAGKITDSLGNPVSNVEVKVTNHAEEGSPYKVNDSHTTTDTSGNYSLPLISGTNFTVTVDAPVETGCADTSASGIDVTTDATRDFSLDPAITLSGKVSASDGTGIAGVRVYLNQQGRLTEADRTDTDAAGNYLFKLPSGSYSLSISGYNLTGFPQSFRGDGVVSNFVLAADTARNIELLPVVQITGKTMDSFGQSIGSVAINVPGDITIPATTGSYAIIIDSTTSDDSGNYSIPVFAGDGYALHAVAAEGLGYAPLTVPAIDARTTTTVDLTLRPGFALSGHVKTTAGQEVSGVTVAVFEQDKDLKVAEAVSGADGSYSTFVAAGSYRLSLSRTAKSPLSNIQLPIFTGTSVVQNVAVSAATVQDAAIPLVTLSGVTKGGSGTPVPNVELTLLQHTVPQTVGYYDVLAGSTTSGETGAFSLPVIAGSGYKIKLTPPHGSHYVSTTIDVQDLTQSGSQDLTLPDQPLLTVKKTGTGAGTITLSAADTTVECGGATCASYFAAETVVTLVAVPAADSLFKGWSGDCSSVVGNTCTATMTQPSTVTAKFDVPLAKPRVIGTSGITVTAKAYSPFSFTPNVTEAASFSVSKTPAWVAFDTRTGTLSGTPTNAEVARTAITITAINSKGTASYSFYLSVVALAKPALSGTPATKVTAGNLYNFKPASSGATGFSITNQPSWASFDTTTGTLSGTPAKADVASYAGIVITATNPAGSTSLAPFAINVMLPLPTISGIPASKATIGIEYSFTPTATDASSFNIVNKPVWATFDTSNGRLYGTPTTSNLGTSTSIYIKASNDTGTVSLAPFFIAVVRPLPTISGEPATTVTTGQSYTFNPIATDATGFSITNKPLWASFSTLTGALTGKPSTSYVGTTSNIVIRAINSTGSAALAAFSITVARPMPTISGAPAAAAPTAKLYSFIPTASNATSFSIGSKPSWATFNTATGALAGTPTFRNGGVYENIVISANNGTGSVSLPAFSITVVPPSPTISGTPPVTVTAGRLYSFTPTATNAASFTIANRPAWASFNPATGALSGTPTGLAATGTYSDIAISAVNSAGSKQLGPFSITVAPPVPTITGVPATSVKAESSYRFGAVSPYATSFTIVNKPSWATFDENTGVLSGTPAIGDIRLYSSITIGAKNSAGTTTLLPFSINVTWPLPTIAGTPDTMVIVKNPYSFTPTATNAKSFSITNKPAWALFNSATGALTGTPTTTGTFGSIIIRAVNPSGSIALPTFAITVLPPLPTIAGTPATTVTTGRYYSFRPTATGASSFTIANRPPWAIFSSSTGSLTGTPALAAVGSYADITISAKNSAGVTPLPPFTLTVSPP